MRNFIQEQIPIEINCDKHITEKINGFSIARKSLICPKCPKELDDRKFIPLKYTDLESTCLNLLELMNRRKEQLHEGIESLKGILEQSISTNST